MVTEMNIARGTVLSGFLVSSAMCAAPSMLAARSGSEVNSMYPNVWTHLARPGKPRLTLRWLLVSLLEPAEPAVNMLVLTGSCTRTWRELWWKRCPQR